MNILNLADRPQYIPILAKWHHHEWSYLNPNDSVQQRMERMQCYLSKDLIPSTFVAIEGETILGSAAIVENDMDTHRHLSPWLAAVYVAPEHRGKGIGSLLVKHVVESARRAKLHALYLFTPSKEPYYSSMGWTTIKKQDYKGVVVTIMQIELNRYHNNQPDCGGLVGQY
jgi:N-acetylglutamate synthase-like GNAT family acetyltransferase